jgi:hypothetical protein
MIRFLLRTIGLLLLAAAFVFFVYDGTKSIAADALVYTKLNEVWTLLHPASLQQLRPAIEGRGVTWLWEPVAAVLDAPAFVVFMFIGAVLMLLGRRKKPLIGYSR